jgi:hypothetical protein
MDPEKHPVAVPLLVGLVTLCATLTIFFQFEQPWSLRGDNKLIHYPMQLEAFRQWTAGQVPFWSDAFWMGYPLLANCETGALYLPRLLGFLLTPEPHLRAFDWATALHFGLLVSGVVALLRRLGCRLAVAIPAAVASAMAPQVLWLTSFAAAFGSLAWWPWLLLASDRLTAADRPYSAVLLASVPLAMQVYTGYPELAVYSGCLAAAWILGVPSVLSWRARVARTLGLVATSVLLAGPQLLPTFRVLEASRRAEAQEARSFLSIQGEAWKVFDPTTVDVLSPFLGGATLLLALIAVIWGAPRARGIAIAALVAGLAALGEQTPVYETISRLPVFELFRGPHKFYLITQLGVLTLAALGLQRLLNLRRAWVSGCGVALAVLCLGEYTLAFGHLHGQVAGRHTFYEAPLDDALARLRPLAAVAAARTSEGGLSPRVYTGWNVFRMGSLPSMLGIETVRGGNVSLLSSRHEWLSRGRLTDAHLDLLGVQLVLERGACGYPRHIRYPVVRQGDGVCIRENPIDVPRFELLSDYRRVPNVEELIEATRNEPAGPVPVLAATASVLPPQGETAGSIVLLEARSGQIQLRVISDEARLLLVRTSWAEGWRATVDDEEAAIYPAAGVFFAVPVPAGSHVVSLTFAAPGFLAGLAMLALWLAIWLVLCVRAFQRKRASG